MPNPVPTTIRIKPETYKVLQRVAKALDRTTPSLVREILDKWVAWHNKNEVRK